MALHVLLPGLVVEASVSLGPHMGPLAGLLRSAAKFWIAWSVLVQLCWFQHWVKNTSLFFHPVALSSLVDLGFGVCSAVAGLDELLAVEAMVAGSAKWLGAAGLGHACMGAT